MREAEAEGGLKVATHVYCLAVACREEVLQTAPDKAVSLAPRRD